MSFSRPPGLIDHRLKAPKPQADPALETAKALFEDLTDDQLLAIRHELDRKLEADVHQLNLVDELGLQYRAGKQLLASCQEDKGTPLNQKAQIFGSVKSQLESIIKMRERAYGQERLKRIEAAIMKALQALGTDEMKAAFFEVYQDYLQQETE